MFSNIKLYKTCWILVLVGCSFSATVASAQDGDADDLAKKATNPLANIISLPLQSNTDFGIGPHDRTGTVLNIQPIYPVSLGKGTLINRMIAPIPKYTPDAGLSSGGTTGIGDVIVMNWYAPDPKGAFMWGGGPVTVWPTATDAKLGADKFSLGPSLVLVLSDPKFVAASVIMAWWSVAGKEEAADVGTFYWQPIFIYFLPNRWYGATAPVILNDLKASSGDESWIVPVGGGIGKMFSLGNLPVDFTTQAYYYAVAPEGGPNWMLRVQLKLIFPKN